MRTTLDIEDDVLELAKQLAKQQGATTGRVVSDLARQGLEPKRRSKIRNGVPLFAARPGARKPGLAWVNRLHDGS